MTALVKSGEYVVIVPPETFIDRSLETGNQTLTIRARVCWVTAEAKENRERNLAAMSGAISDEAAKCGLPVESQRGE